MAAAIGRHFCLNNEGCGVFLFELRMADGDTPCLFKKKKRLGATRQIPSLRMSMDRFDICTVLCCGCEMDRTDTSRTLIVRTSWEFEVRERQDPGVHLRLQSDLSDRRRSDEDHKFVTIFLDVKTGVAGFETEPNNENMEHD